MEAIKVNLIPNGIPEACHASQYDEGRQIRLDIFDGLTPYTIQAGDTFTLNVRKPDNHVITETVTGTEGNTYLVIDTTEQMTAVTGENLCEIRLENGGNNIGSLNFIMQVEKDVIANGIPSESVIEDLEALVVEAVGDNYYTKSETDELLEQKADVTDLLDLLPTDNASGALASFTDGADNVPVKALSVEFAASQASGTPTPSAPIPITPVNSIAVTRTGKNLLAKSFEYYTGVSTDLSEYFFIKAGTYCFSFDETEAANWRFVIRMKDASGNNLSGNDYKPRSSGISWSNNANGWLNTSNITAKALTLTFVTDCYIRILFGYGDTSASTTMTKPQLELGSTATAYEAYNGVTKTLDLGGDYYGGSVDAVTGKITKKWSDKFTFDGSVSVNTVAKSGSVWFVVLLATLQGKNTTASALTVKSDKFVCRSGVSGGDDHCYITNNGTALVCVLSDQTITTKEQATQWFQNNPTSFIYELETPETEYASNAIDLNTLLGDNNIFSDAGDVDVTIRADIALYIQKMLGGNANRSLGANPSILRAGAISTDIEVREPVEPDSEPVELEREADEQPESESNDSEER